MCLNDLFFTIAFFTGDKFSQLLIEKSPSFLLKI